MRAIGITLMVFGIFFVFVAAAAIFGPAFRAIGIEVQAETTSVIGSALIGVFAFATGTLLRRRGTEAAQQKLARARAGANEPAQLGEGPARPLGVPQRDRAEDATRDDQTR
jgi:hypothetical protein